MPILNPDYDPDWKSRFDRALNLVDRTHDQNHLNAMHHAFWCQYRTMAEIRDFHINATIQRADAHDLELTLIPHIDDDCTWDDISTVYSVLNNAIDEYLFRPARRPYRQPDGLDAFLDDTSAQRFTEHYEYDGFQSRSACNLTIEYQENAAHVCFTLLENSGTSPINMMADLATIVYRDLLFGRYEPQEVSWYAYHRSTLRGFGFEGFIQAIMRWDRRYKSYGAVEEWRHFSSIPVPIVRTTEADGDDRPEPLVRPRRRYQGADDETANHEE